jgi:hypothetical protein
MANENSLPFDPGKVSDLIKQGKIHIISALSPIGSLPHEIHGRASETAKLTEARAIMGDEFFGPDEVKTALGYDLDRSLIPEVPFSTQELVDAKADGQFLILYATETADGKPITMKRLDADLGAKFAREGKGKVLYDTTGWYKNEKFFTTFAPRQAWRLVTKGIIPNSTSHNYLEQIDDIASHISNSVYAGRTLPTDYQEALAEFYAQRAEIEGLMTSDWKEAARRLAILEMNSMFRQTPVEALYAGLVYFQNRDQRLLETTYAWTNTQASGGSLVNVGYADAEGVYVGFWDPGHSNGHIGVVLSR